MSEGRTLNFNPSGDSVPPVVGYDMEPTSTRSFLEFRGTMPEKTTRIKVLIWCRDHLREILFFRLTMWAVVICSLGSVVSKALIGRPSSIPLHYLLGFAIVASLLAVVVPSLESYVFSRITEISIGGVKLELIAAAGVAISELQYKEKMPSEIESDSSPNEPFPTPELTGPQRYHYERLSHKLYRIFDQIKDPNQLDRESRDNYRELVKTVGRAAFAMKHFTKSLEILVHLEALKDRELTPDELYLIGNGYLWAGDELSQDAERKEYVRKSLPFLKAAMEKNSYEAKFPYDLGWALLTLDQYQDGIDQFTSSIGKRPSIAPFANWNIACGLKKLNNNVEALNKLREIPPGPWWEGIAKDDWFADPENADFSREFEALCQTKGTKHT